MNSSRPTGDPFKQCTMCQQHWPSRQRFLEDPAVVVVGYQACFPQPDLGLFLFNHLRCETTLALEASAFVDLYEGPIYTELKIGDEGCMGYCLNSSALDSCSNQCECAYVREVLQIVRQWPKTQGD